jgi:hypothetical protein
MAGIKNKIVQTYEDCHRITSEGELQKKCSIHETYSQGEDPWFPCTDEYFYKTKNKTDGLASWCKKCSSLKSQKWALENPEKKKEFNKRNKLNPNKPANDKRSNVKKRAAGYFAEYIKRPEVKARKYHLNHRNHEITIQEWISCKNYFKDKDGDWCCAYCGMKIQNHWITYKGKLIHSDFHKEHKDDKGANDLRNCIPSCRDCNSNKWTWEFEEWYRKQDFFTEERYNKIIKWCTEDYKLYIKDRPPYRIIGKRDEIDKQLNYELWIVDELRNLVECVDVATSKRDLNLELALNP